MRNSNRWLAVFLLSFSFPLLAAISQELPCDVGPRTIRAYSIVQSNSICLAWPQNDFRLELRVSRRVYTNRPSAWQNWVEIYAITNPVLAKPASVFCDTNVTNGIHYEYQISALIPSYDCNWRTTAGFWDYQYISTGSEVPLKDQRGKLLLLIESSLSAPLYSELARLEQDLIGDGYQVFRHDVKASEVTAPGWKTNVANLKALIKNNYNSDTNADWSIFIVGHVPIPYSGLSSPGSHTENFGAHPSDWYYADMNEEAWTDTTANDATARYPWNWNTPGDGKFDQSLVPSTPELKIGRVDLFNMPAFGKSEVELLRQYLNRNHAWRHKLFSVRDRGLIFTAGFPHENHSIYSSFFGSTTNVDLGAWLSVATNSQNSYLFAASKGWGEFERDGQLGYTTNFAATTLYAVFTTMQGSYYGHWNSAVHSNVVLLAPLAAEGCVLSTYYHEQMMNVDSSSMGEGIGNELFAMAANWYVTESNWQKIFRRYNPYARVVDGNVYVITERLKNYTTLMGDPTLRLRVVAPPKDVKVRNDGNFNLVSWTSAIDSNIQGYHVYRAPVTNLNAFIRLTTTPVVSTGFMDLSPSTNSYRYMVRTVKLEQSANRSYYNASQGIFANPDPKLTATITSPNGITLTVSGELGRQYIVENSTNLSDAVGWVPLTNITLSETNVSVNLASTNRASFYRVK